MGGNGSTIRKVSFGMDEDEKVTVIEGVKVLLLFLQQTYRVESKPIRCNDDRTAGS